MSIKSLERSLCLLDLHTKLHGIVCYRTSIKVIVRLLLTVIDDDVGRWR
jgi:hypothetical protein